MRRLFAKLKFFYRWTTDRRGFFLARIFGLRVPVFPLAHLPDGFNINRVGSTGLSIVEKFCTAAEAAYLIDKARVHLKDSRITINNQQITDPYRKSKTAIVFDNHDQDPQIIPLLYRAGMLVGLPPTHVETVFVTRYSEGEYYKAHEDFYPGFDGDRLYTVLIYLNDLDDSQGGGTLFEKLNIGVKPRLGRAVIWTNTNPDGSHHPETRHEAMPVTNGAEKWVIQLWYRNYPLVNVASNQVAAPQTAAGQPLTGDEPLPPGAWVVGEVEADSHYARAFS